MKVPGFVFLCLVLHSRCIESNEHFSAVADLRQLLQTETVILAELRRYKANLIEHLQLLQSEIDAIKTEHLLAAADIEGYLSNPVNAYRLIKRLHTDWQMLEETVSNDNSQSDFLEAMATHRNALSYPTQEDMDGAAIALVRLQDTYQLDVGQVASGILNGVKYGPPMSWQDCYVLGSNLYEMHDFNHTIPWLKQSMEFLNAEEYSTDETSLDFVENVAAYHQEMGDFENALTLINHILTVDASRQSTLLETKVTLQQLIRDGIKTGLLHENGPPAHDNSQNRDFQLYERVCRGDVTISQTPQARALRCQYHTNNVPYRLLQPFKMEELHLEPLVVRYHDMLDDSDLERVKRLGQRRMTRSTTLQLNGEKMASMVRTSKNAWIAYTAHRVTRRMLRQVGDFSALSTSLVEEMQLANYGMGGHYEPHWDFFVHDVIDLMSEGNRISTAMYYLSDVEEGGGTAFPYLGLLVKPIKGSVIFWYNIHRSEEPDFRTRHAACPVLKGSKWIANIWLRSRNQMHTRPCGLQPDHEISEAYRDYNSNNHPVFGFKTE